MKEVSDFSVQKIEHYQDNDFMLYVNPINKKLNQGKPGQFVNILVEGSPTTMLRRPISICDVNAETNTLLLYIKQVGDGTRQLAQLKKAITSTSFILLEMDSRPIMLKILYSLVAEQA